MQPSQEQSGHALSEDSGVQGFRLEEFRLLVTGFSRVLVRPSKINSVARPIQIKGFGLFEGEGIGKKRRETFTRDRYKPFVTLIVF